MRQKSFILPVLDIRKRNFHVLSHGYPDFEEKHSNGYQNIRIFELLLADSIAPCSCFASLTCLIFKKGALHTDSENENLFHDIFLGHTQKRGVNPIEF